jgi:IS5 family transposase
LRAFWDKLLLSVWYDLSDVKLAEALDDRASFRAFCGFSRTEATPERTAFVRFRKALVARNLDRLLFTTVTAQLKAKAIVVKSGTLVDATIIASASEDDDDARWVKHQVPLVAYGLYGTGRKTAFTRNRKLVELKPVEAVLCEGSGLQANLYQLLRQGGVPIHAFKKADQVPDTQVRRIRA